ncbi:hypothetical protein ACFX2I_036712 [Malus domestica]
MTLNYVLAKNWYTMLLFANGLVSHAMLLQQSPCPEPFLHGVGRHHPSTPQGTSCSSDSSVSKTTAFAALCLSDGSFAKIEAKSQPVYSVAPNSNCYLYPIVTSPEAYLPAFQILPCLPSYIRAITA